MKYVVQLGIGYEESKWMLDNFTEDRRRYLSNLIEKYKRFDGRYIKGLEHVEFHQGTPELARLLREECESKGYIYNIGAGPCYSREEIAAARYVPLASKDDVVDMDDEGDDLNEYKDVLCMTCGITNDRKVPSPYRIYSKRVKQPRDLFGAMNGINIVSILAFELLRTEIEPWIDFGRVQIVDRKRRPVESAHEYVWVRPELQVGRFTNAVTNRSCDKCKSPTEIRMERSADIFEANKWVIESFENVKAPIVLAGNWFGEIDTKTTSNQSRDVFISGELHEKMRKLKLNGFVESDCAVHAADEPYEWDPLKDYHPPQ